MEPVTGATHLSAAQAVPRRRETGALTSVLERNAFTIGVVAACMALQSALVRGAIGADSWYTLLAGRVIARGGLPQHDSLTMISAGRRWVDQQWLAQLSLYGLWRAGGWAAASLAGVALYGAAFGVLAVSARRRGSSDRSTALVLLACFLMGLPNTQLRAQVPAYLLFAVVMALLLADERRPSRKVWLTLPLLIVWANVHGSVVLGAAVVSAYAVVRLVTGMRSGRATFAGALGLFIVPWLCVLASPYALELPSYYRKLLDNPTLAHSVSEWAPSTLRGQPVFFGVLVASALLVGLARKALTPLGLATLALTGILGLLAVRNDVWLALAGAAVLPAALDGVWHPGTAPRRRGVNLAIVLVAVCFSLVFAGTIATKASGWFERSYPPTAASAAVAPHGNVFADERYADWLLFEAPGLAGRIAFDIRYELLSRHELQAIGSGAVWRTDALGYPILVLDPGRDAGSIRFFEHRSGTRVLYRDKNVVVLEQRP
jgi:hypothetical protein